MHYDIDEFKLAFGARIKALRNARGWTRMHMMRDFGYYLSAWQNIESGKKLSLESVLRIANTFDMTLDELLGDIKRSKGSGYGSKNYHLKTPAKDSSTAE